MCVMISLETFIEETNRAKTSEEIFLLYQKALKQFGYDGICYCLVTDHPTYGLKANHGAMQNYPDEWIKYYSQNKYKEIDPVLQFCFKTNQIFSWDALVNSKELANDEKLLMNEATEAKLLDGLAVPIHGVNNELTAIGLASTSGNAEINKDSMSIIRALSIQFHIAYAEKEAALSEAERITILNKQKNLSLSDREREILLWVSEGKSDPVIADILGISYPTVRFHMNNIFRKLEVNERTLAVVKAIRHGLILPTYLKRF